MRIVNVLEATVPLSRYADPATAPGDLDTSVVAVLTDVMRGGRPVVGLGYGSVGRYAQGGLIRARSRRACCKRPTEPARTHRQATWTPRWRGAR